MIVFHYYFDHQSSEHIKESLCDYFLKFSFFISYPHYPSPIHDHSNITGHEISLDNVSIVGRENQSIARAIREAMLITVNDPSLNRNIGKYQLPHIWDEVLVKSPELKLKYK